MATHKISLKVNGQQEELEVPSNMTLMTMLREKLILTGTKNACSNGQCGACTVLMNGQPVQSCLVLAVEADGAEIVTVEGLSKDGKLTPLQELMIEKGAVQCGFCTPGMVMTAYALLQRNPHPTEEQIREAISGNICRCSGFVQLVEAIQAAANLQ
jgi:carbon-monoxide dehydrogenase small subunit